MIIFQSFLLISLLHVVDQDTNQQTGCPGLIYGTVGQNVTLTCKLEEKLEDVYLSWTSKNESSGLLKQVHVFRNEGDDEKSQDVDYKKRTSVFPEQFEHGNISLELANVTKKDEGTYTWTVRIDNVFFNSGNITLRVVENGSQGNWTGVKNIVVPILCVLAIIIAIIAIIAIVVAKWNEIREWFNSRRNRHEAVAVDDDRNGEGGHAEGNDPPSES